MVHLQGMEGGQIIPLLEDYMYMQAQKCPVVHSDVQCTCIELYTQTQYLHALQQLLCDHMACVILTTPMSTIKFF